MRKEIQKFCYSHGRRFELSSVSLIGSNVMFISINQILTNVVMKFSEESNEHSIIE
jgi:hypothetical protein